MSEPGDSGGDTGSFLDRFGELVLLAHASGQAVEGSWYVVIDNPVVPDVHVEITRIDDDPRPGPQESTVSGTDDRPFEHQLESFLLTAFAEGEEITGTWVLRYGRREFPGWEVEIQLGLAGADDGTDPYPVGTPDDP